MPTKEQASTGSAAGSAWPLMTWIPMFWCGAANAGSGPAAQRKMTYASAVASGARLAASAAKVNAEYTSLATRRIQAWQSIPADMAKLRTPAELVSAQMRFWQTAADHHAATFRAVMEAWTGLLPVQERAAAPVERDRLVLPDESAGTPARQQTMRMDPAVHDHPVADEHRSAA